MIFSPVILDVVTGAHSEAGVAGVQAQQITLVYWGSFGELAVIFQLLASVTQLSWLHVAGMIPNDSGKLESGQSTHF